MSLHYETTFVMYETAQLSFIHLPYNFPTYFQIVIVYIVIIIYQI